MAREEDEEKQKQKKYGNIAVKRYTTWEMEETPIGSVKQNTHFVVTQRSKNM